ncbi:uncharacterized protein LOC126576151 isoform X1 [Anopheles aquasalis]|uniref:uncharacterized protein LOC126576151 isoform X1 n=1 Tax=Anopheles aquasalis TaxID=42839 RepID=UPI00215A6275|nr:uncharacterized protein LOC126576151 isoform X1 [Anopheles aquasalis]XP_050093254.1 uncharacterized protein LOC126576151 isoform X1 [Anopheles aquasalis]XP_050093255.1 uncharacterized protein LOC126576151 isoform X1 [Anopheles aquasalis]XP_050093256.1 uncharacterized protein LOC126576151 isoform X1 [Anopheles aquasalis]XP_050093257.1 uncharacterized protein LOC126576151 isoform X1 [Anopheles aquasalis]XP_050093259.1 uncharacterized protein LOC126576151 isoform X1 [Anopheles aquasalis]
MRHQLLLVLTVSLCAIAVNSSPALKPDLPKAKDPLFDKMLAETSRPIPDAHDPRFNKMLPDPDNNLIADDDSDEDAEDESLLNDDILPEKALDLNPKYAQKANKDKPEVSTVGSVAVNKVKINDDIDNYEAQLLKGNGKKLPVIAIVDDELPQVEDLTGEIILPLVTSTNVPLVEITSSPSSTTAKASTTEGDDSYADDDEYDDESDEAIDFSLVDKVLAQPIKKPIEEPVKVSSTSTTAKPKASTVAGTGKQQVEILDQYDDDADLDYQYNYDDDEDDDDSEDDDDDDDDDEETVSAAVTPKADKTAATVEENKSAKKLSKPIKLSKDSNKATNKTEKTDYYQDYYDDDDEEEDDDDSAYTSNNTHCPEDCICEHNMHAYMVATCSRLDLEKQKFGSHITDLQVLDVGPMYPIELGPDFFKKIGLSHVVSIKITNCTIVYISPQAFAGLDELYSVNLTNSGIDLIHPDTFVNNTKLRLLTLSGNDLSAMQSVNHNTPYTDYMLKAPSVEELDLSRCKLQELQPNAFNELKNIIFINLSENNLSNLPQGIFDNVETIEELDLSMNNIAELPKHIFAKTSLAILHLRHNKISNNVDFVTADLQKLDLSFCRIRSINNQMFKGMDGLTNLILKGNHIEKIKPMAFISLRSLRQIDLSYNNLDQISAQTFIGNKMLDIIRLNNNPALKRLPNEGFESSYNVPFNVYFMDISNCDISELADNTFKTMPQLTRLNLAWNNLQTIRPAVMAHLSKLMDLDLSNNMITELDDKTFQNNRNLNTLNLSGNQISSLVSKLFQPLQYLSELDISDCDLRTIWEDSSDKIKREEVLPNLKRLNASYNELTAVYVSDLETMAKLRVLDIRNNSLTCNDHLQPLIKYVQQKQISMSRSPMDHVTHAELNTARVDNIALPFKQWSQFAWEICQGNGGDPEKTLSYSETEEDDYDEDDDEEADDVDADILEKTSATANKVDNNKNDLDEYSDESADSDDDDSSDSDDEDEDDDEEEEEQEQENILDAANGLQKMEQAILTSKYGSSSSSNKNRIIEDEQDFDDDEDDSNADEVVILEGNGGMFAMTYMWIVLVCVVLALCVILVVVRSIIELMVKRRGERYRQAILASKNSFVYQKLTEDIAAPTTPKVHRYAPINQV